MVITICGSIKFAKEMIETEKALKKKGFKVLLPEMAKSFADGKFSLENFKDDRTTAEFKKKYDLIKKHFKEVTKGDAILVLNYDRKGVKNYIGGGAYAEMVVAYYLGRPIYLLNPIPQELSYATEIEAMEPIILNGDLNNIK